mmetsp:Transcript_1466/g.1464  ORF Transcript_1466/g.1464 Transcript_1466/m.1464 type:complete len:270 (+) Transcript_1466:107-916(+)|eukprot:CAMPEP_0174821144 /NCGR_PEP_ID=MMETSP1107-20130205/5760_1 /TAXON_ID=36770 /ORGANISM="Paraphysomonas vestita, Strain GFlagA" /LENGTH=269 /DNA_ID=CAMNT_0016037867 /DNA_START=73 /DNA_END=882 /DNA_ORIENTATION=-
MFHRSIVSRRFLTRLSHHSSHNDPFHGHPRAHPRCAEILGFTQEVRESLVSAFHVGRSLDLAKVGALFQGPSTTTGSDFVKVVTNENEKKAFDVYRFGSVVFYNTPREEQRETTAKLLALEVDAASAPYQMEGYDNYDTLLEVYVDKSKVEQYGLNNLGLESWSAAGALLARTCALQFYDAALDRVIDGIFTINEDELKGHVSYITNSVNSINVFEDPKFTVPSSNAIYTSMKQDLKPDALYSEFHFKQAVLRNQYKITGAPELQGTVA